MTPRLRDALADLDAGALRRSAESMRGGLRTVVAAGAADWNAALPDLVAALAATARVDLTLARLVEGHADAQRILTQSGDRPSPGVYGVWASRSVGTGLAGRFRDGRWQVSGELRFASGIGLVDRALVPVWVEETHHQLLDLELDPEGFLGQPDSWRTTAMDASRSWTVQVETDAALTAAVGPLDWYLQRPGFLVGGLGVAAVWAGGAQHVRDLLLAGARQFGFGPAQLRRLGAVEQATWEAWSAVEATAAWLPDLSTDRVGEEVGRARTAVALACERVLHETPHIVGPGGLSRNESLVRTTADLGIYVRQLALDSELEGLGRRLVHERTDLP